MKLLRHTILLLSFLLIIVSPLKAEVLADSLKQALSVVKDEYHRIFIYLEISKSLKTTNIDSAIFYAESAREIALEEGDDKDVAESLFILGKMNLRRDSTHAARDDFDLALKYTDKCDCDSLEAAIYMFLGKLYTFHDNYEEAIVNFLKSQEIAEEIDNILILEDLLDDIGLVMAYLQDYDDAMEYFERALEINKVTADKQNHATTLRNIGTIYQNKKQFVKAKQRFKEALDIYTSLNYFPGMSTANIGIGNTEFGMENYSTALEYYQKALHFARQIDTSPKVYGPFIVTMSYNRLGETYLKLGKYNEAMDVLRISSDLSEKYGMPGNKAEASYFFSNVYEQTGNTILSFEYFKIYNQLSDSIINARNVSIITKLQMEYQYLKKHKERQLEEMMKEEAYKRKVLVYELMIGVSVIMLILLAMIFILYRKNQRGKAQKAELVQKNLELEKENLQKELGYKNRELTTSVMYQLKKNNFIWSISEYDQRIVGRI